MDYKEITIGEVDELILKGEILKKNILKNQYYLSIYSLYKKFLIEYLLTSVNLIQFDNRIKNCELNFSVINKEKMNCYQLFSNEILNFFYLRSNLYLEHLSEEEEEELINRIHNQNYEFDFKAEIFIKNTYKKVLKAFNETQMKDDEIAFERMIIYDDVPIEDGTLVIGMRYNKFAENGLNGKEWLEMNTKKTQYLYSLFAEMKKEFKEKLLIPVEIIEY